MFGDWADSESPPDAEPGEGRPLMRAERDPKTTQPVEPANLSKGQAREPEQSSRHLS